MMWGYADGSAFLWMLFLWGGVIAIVIYVVRAFSGPRSNADPAMATLREHLAAGRISQEEFDEIKRTLQG